VTSTHELTSQLPGRVAHNNCLFWRMAIVEENEGLLASAYIYLGTTVSRYSTLTYPASLLLYLSPCLSHCRLLVSSPLSCASSLSRLPRHVSIMSLLSLVLLPLHHHTTSKPQESYNSIHFTLSKSRSIHKTSNAHDFVQLQNISQVQARF
jgi:hypothetical protein